MNVTGTGQENVVGYFGRPDIYGIFLISVFGKEIVRFDLPLAVL